MITQSLTILSHVTKNSFEEITEKFQRWKQGTPLISILWWKRQAEICEFQTSQVYIEKLSQYGKNTLSTGEMVEKSSYWNV